MKSWIRCASLVVFAGVVATACSSSPTSTPASSSAPTASGTAAPVACDPAVPTVQTSTGPVCGTQQTTDSVTASAYLGVPYATPPIGPLRWRAPEPAQAWTQAYPATQTAQSCSQPTTTPTFTTYVGGEDCLYINVWTPATTAASPRPVVVYLPGGGFLTGGGDLPGYNGAYMAASQDVIVVNINYRLGALGFMRYQDNGADIPGNFGILDQQAAMQWVQDNAAAFGGNPQQVTIWGESAGAVSTALHLFAIPESAPLFRAAIMDSNISGPPLPTPTTAATVGTTFVELLCQYQTVSDCPRTQEWLRTVPIEAIMTAESSAAPAQGIHGLFLSAGPISWAPTVGVPPITAQPLLGYAAGMPAKPFVMGHNSQEGAFFTPEPAWMTVAEYQAWLTASFTTTGATAILDYASDGTRPYNASTYVFDVDKQMTPAAQAYMRAVTDGVIVSPNILTLQRVQAAMSKAGMPMIGYEFSNVSSFNYNDLPQCSPQSKNVCHSYELPFVFNNMVQESTAGWETLEVPEAERAVAVGMTKAWAGFVKDPSATGWGWPAITDPTAGPYVQFDTTTTTFTDAAARAHYDLWKPFLKAGIARMSSNG